MTTMYVTEFDTNSNHPDSGNSAVPNYPPLNTFTLASGANATLSAKTRLIEISTDSIFSYRVAPPGSTATSVITATTSDPRIPANTIKLMAVLPSSILACITNT
jgi:hypothetical protein